MVVGKKRNGLRAVFVAFLAVLTVQCVHSYTTTERITTQTQTAMQTTSITDSITTMPIIVTSQPDSDIRICDSNSNCSQREYCELRNPNVSGSCESCYDSCESCSGPENKDCTSCNISSFIVQHVVYDGEATTPTGTNTTVQTTAVTTATVEPTTVITDSRTLTFGPTSTSRSPDVTGNVTSSSTYPNATTMITTMSIETTPEPRNYTIKLECVDECPSGLKPPWDSSKVCCHVQCKNKGCYGSSISSCCQGNCRTGCYGDGIDKCCPDDCHPDYGCNHNGQCRKFITPTEGLPLWAWIVIGVGGGIVVTGGIIGIICCCIRRRRREPREETDEGEENIGMKKRKSKKRKRNSYVPGPNSVRNPEMDQDGPYANEEYVDPAGLANPAHQQDDAYDDVNVNADVYVEPQPDQFNPGSTDDDIYDQPPLEELNHHQGAANYGYHDDALAQQDAVYGNDPNQFSGDQYPVSGDQYPVSGDQYPVLGDQYPVSGDQYPVSGDQYPVSGDQYPVSGDAGQSGVETAEPVYQNTGFAAQSNAAQEDPSMYQNFDESNSQPGAHEDPNLYYNYTAQHDLPPDDEQFLSVDSMPSLDPPPPPEDTPSHFQTSQLPPSVPPADLPSLPPPPPPTQTPTPVTQSPRHTASPHGTAGGRKKTRKVPPPPPAGPRPESARRAQRPPHVQVRNRRQQEPAAEIYGYENDQSEVYGYDN